MSKITTIWTYQLNGVQTEFAVNFDYLSRKFVKVTLLGGGDRRVLRLNVDYRFIGAKTIKTNVAWGISQGYDYIEIRRETSATDPIVDFSDGSILRAGDLTIANLQSMHIAEEARNIASDGIGVNDEGNLDARFRKIINLGDPVNRKDAVTKAYVDDAAEGVIDSRDKALQYRNEAETFKNQANTFRGQAESAKDRAITAESNARSSASSAQSSKDQATTQASKAAESMASAQKSASNAVTSEKKAKASETEAAGSAKRAEDAAAKAVGGGLPIVGGTMTGPINFTTNSYLNFNNNNESLIKATRNKTEFLAYMSGGTPSVLTYRFAIDGTRKYLRFPNNKEGTIATLEETVKKSGDTMTGKLFMESPNPAIELRDTDDNFKTSYYTSKTSGGCAVFTVEQLAPQATLSRIEIPKGKKGTIALAEETVPKTGGEFTGIVTLKGDPDFFKATATSSEYCELVLTSIANKTFKVGIGPTSCYMNTDIHGSKTSYLLPKKSGTLALADDYVPKTGGAFFAPITVRGHIPLQLTTTHTNGDIISLVTEGQSRRTTILYNKQFAMWNTDSETMLYFPTSGTVATTGSYKLDDHYKRTRSSIAKSKLSERELRKEIEDLKAQVQELREMLLNVTN